MLFGKYETVTISRNRYAMVMKTMNMKKSAITSVVRWWKSTNEALYRTVITIMTKVATMTEEKGAKRGKGMQIGRERER